MIHPLLKNIDSLDYNDAEQARDFGNLFINYANTLGWGICTPIAASVCSEMLSVGKKWLNAVKTRFEKFAAGDALNIFSTYDLIYRIVYKAVPDPKFAYSIISKALDAQIHGDKDTDVYQLYRLIDNGLMFTPELYKDKPLKWLSIMLDSWHKEFKTGHSLNLGDSDILNRTAILISADLWAFEQDQDKFKQRLFTNHRHYLDNLLNHVADYNLPTLTALGNFINASWNTFLSKEERDRSREAALEATYTKTTSPYVKASIECMLESCKQYC